MMNKFDDWDESDLETQLSSGNRLRDLYSGLGLSNEKKKKRDSADNFIEEIEAEIQRRKDDDEWEYDWDAD